MVETLLSCSFSGINNSSLILFIISTNDWIPLTPRFLYSSLMWPCGSRHLLFFSFMIAFCTSTNFHGMKSEFLVISNLSWQRYSFKSCNSSYSVLIFLFLSLCLNSFFMTSNMLLESVTNTLFSSKTANGGSEHWGKSFFFNNPVEQQSQSRSYNGVH